MLKSQIHIEILFIFKLARRSCFQCGPLLFSVDKIMSGTMLSNCHHCISALKCVSNTVSDIQPVSSRFQCFSCYIPHRPGPWDRLSIPRFGGDMGKQNWDTVGRSALTDWNKYSGTYV
jgi:hypothetical protein